MFTRRGFLKALGIGAVAVVATPLLPAAPVKACKCRKPHGPSKYSTKEELIAALMENALETHDRLLEEALFAQTPGPFTELANV